jgi:AraC family transcriptional regulator of adaptative response / DNA-3-methyladenine glycosylase II
MPAMQSAPPEFESCYRAVAARDARFDGMFYTAVKTTGIYCRPVCPARTPSRSSCTFFSTAAAAESAGFRPCLRCHPELAPGRPDFAATLAQSIYHRIAAGALDCASLQRLAEQIGISTRHLRRLVVTHFGVTPLEIALTQRLLFAKKLLHETHLGMTQVALASGFGSVRRFNDAFLQQYRLAPSALRRLSAPVGAVGDTVRLRLDYRPPFDAPRWFGYLGARAVAGVEAGDASHYVRSIRVALGEHEIDAWFELRSDAKRNALEVTLPVTLTPVLLKTVQRIRQMFDLDADPKRIAEHLSGSPLLSHLIEDHGALRVLGAWQPFELAFRTIVGQQVSVRGASTLAARIASKYCQRASFSHPELSLMPLRDTDLAAVSQQQLCDLGVTRQRAQTLLNLARFSADGGLSFEQGAGLDDMVERLCAVPGIGAWTAQYVAMRGFAQADAFPAGDLALRQAAARLAKEHEMPSIKQLEQLSHQWRPWRAYAASALWASLKMELQ